MAILDFIIKLVAVLLIILLMWVPFGIAFRVTKPLPKEEDD